ncbi:hypothetical protein MBLNU457_6315t1 [Dothideomycetes sp. NU457]
MAYNEENSARTMRGSGLRPPSRIPATVGLSEMTISDNNIRAMMPPPATLKHKGSSLPEPPFKRKTLVERAVEAPRSMVPTTPSSRPVNPAVKATVLAGIKPVQLNSSNVPRNPPISSRSTSKSSSTTRPPSAASHYRSQSAMSNGRAASGEYANGTRPGTALEDYEETPQPTTKRKGTPPFVMSASCLQDRLRPAKNRERSDKSGLPLPSPAREDLSGSQSHFPLSIPAKNPFRTVSLSTAFQGLSLQQDCAWDTKGRLEDMENLYSQLRSQFEGAAFEKTGLEESLTLYKTRLNELEQIRLQLTASNQTKAEELTDIRVQLSTTTLALDDARRTQRVETDEMVRRHRNEVEDIREQQRKESERMSRDHRDEIDRLRRESQEEAERVNRLRRDELSDQEKALKAEVEEERSKRIREVQDLTTHYAIQRQNVDSDMSQRDRELQQAKTELEETRASLSSANSLVKNLKEKLEEASVNTLSLETSMKALQGKIEFLESDNQAQSQAFVDLNQKMQDAIDAAEEAKEKLRTEETLRRKLHNQVQELKGNIRVFCRVRPALEEDAEDRARITFPDSDSDSKEVAIQGPEQKSALGNVTSSTSNFSFDRVFSPASQNAEVFDEISQLVQSALDGYNVCIFCYGQTGSGKTYTMSAVDGMIPRAVNQIYETATSLEEKGWKYTMEGSFIEVYNETLNDLLGKAEDWEKKKHEIKHDPTKSKTTVTGVNTVVLDSPARVNNILEKAGRNRSVAATMANSRSSRSHSVFILRLTGENSITGERSEGTLNLVDLAGSERLSHSGATGERMKETQHINKSLSCLGDVIGALGQGKEGGHIPYRNSKLTYLLQYSLGGNSKTLMFVMISPRQAHLSETLTSLKFATKVHNTHIGTAKRQAKVKE